MLDGYKVIGDGAHKRQIDYYDGFFVQEDYLERKLPEIMKIIGTLKSIVRKKLV